MNLIHTCLQIWYSQQLLSTSLFSLVCSSRTLNLIWRHFANAYNDSPTNGRVIQELLMWAWSSLSWVYKMCSAGCQVNTSPPPSVAATVLPRSAPTLNPVLTSLDHQRSSRHRGNCISESSLQATSVFRHFNIDFQLKFYDSAHFFRQSWTFSLSVFHRPPFINK